MDVDCRLLLLVEFRFDNLDDACALMRQATSPQLHVICLCQNFTLVMAGGLLCGNGGGRSFPPFNVGKVAILP